MSAYISAPSDKAMRSEVKIMAKFKLTSKGRTVVPDIILRDPETGEKIENRSLEPGTRIEADITHVNYEEKLECLGSYTKLTKKTKTKKSEALTYNEFRVEACIRKHVISIRGCMSEWYRDGNTLWDGPESREQDAIVISLFHRILGMEDDEEEENGEFNNDGPADLTVGEN